MHVGKALRARGWGVHSRRERRLRMSGGAQARRQRGDHAPRARPSPRLVETTLSRDEHSPMIAVLRTVLWGAVGIALAACGPREEQARSSRIAEKGERLHELTARPRHWVEQQK